MLMTLDLARFCGSPVFEGSQTARIEASAAMLEGGGCTCVEVICPFPKDPAIVKILRSY